MPGKRKGNRRERECYKLYEEAGYRCYKPQESQYGETDMYGLFDLVAFQRTGRTHWVQVKSNRAAGIESWAADAREWLGPHSRPRMAVCHDAEGWRILSPRPSEGYQTLFDGRESNARMGRGLVEYLRGDSDG